MRPQFAFLNQPNQIEPAYIQLFHDFLAGKPFAKSFHLPPPVAALG
jgi:hypothetical protein